MGTRPGVPPAGARLSGFSAHWVRGGTTGIPPASTFPLTCGGGGGRAASRPAPPPPPTSFSLLFLGWSQWCHPPEAARRPVSEPGTEAWSHPWCHPPLVVPSTDFTLNTSAGVHVRRRPRPTTSAAPARAPHGLSRRSRTAAGFGGRRPRPACATPAPNWPTSSGRRPA